MLRDARGAALILFAVLLPLALAAIVLAAFATERAATQRQADAIAALLADLAPEESEQGTKIVDEIGATLPFTITLAAHADPAEAVAPGTIRVVRRYGPVEYAIAGTAPGADR